MFKENDFTRVLFVWVIIGLFGVFFWLKHRLKDMIERDLFGGGGAGQEEPKDTLETEAKVSGAGMPWWLRRRFRKADVGMKSGWAKRTFNRFGASSYRKHSKGGR